MEEIDQALLQLVDLGYVNVSYTDDLEAVFTITEKGKEFIKEIDFGL